MKKTISLFVFSLCLLFVATVAFAYPHTWGEWEFEKRPTCLEDGVLIRACMNYGCSSHERIPVNKLDHDYSVATCSAPSTCLNGCNQTIGTTLPHTFAPATCISKATCTECGAQEGELGPHNFVSASCLTPKTCTICGVTSGGLDSHQYIPANCLAPATCTVCGHTTGGLGYHNYVYGTCLDYTFCKICGDQQPGLHQWEKIGDVTTCTICGMSGLCRTVDVPCEDQ